MSIDLRYWSQDLRTTTTGLSVELAALDALPEPIKAEIDRQLAAKQLVTTAMVRGYVKCLRRVADRLAATN